MKATRKLKKKALRDAKAIMLRFIDKVNAGHIMGRQAYLEMLEWLQKYDR